MIALKLSFSVAITLFSRLQYPSDILVHYYSCHLSEVTDWGSIYVTCVQSYKLGNNHADVAISICRMEVIPITRMIKILDIKGPD